MSGSESVTLLQSSLTFSDSMPNKPSRVEDFSSFFSAVIDDLSILLV